MRAGGRWLEVWGALDTQRLLSRVAVEREVKICPPGSLRETRWAGQAIRNGHPKTRIMCKKKRASKRNTLTRAKARGV